MTKKVILSLIAVSVVISWLFLLTCSLPSNPVDDPTNFNVKIFPKDTSTILTGKKAFIAFAINIPKHLKTLRVNFGEGGLKDTAIEYTNQSFTTIDTIYFSPTYDSAGVKNITATAYLTTGTSKQFYGKVTVIQSDNPSNFNIKIFLKENKPVAEGKQAEIGLVINSPKYLKNLLVNFGEQGIKDSSILYTKQNQITPDTLYVSCIYTANVKKEISVTAVLTDESMQKFTTSLDLNANQFSIVFDTIPVADTIPANAPDSLRFVAHSEPGDSLIIFSITSIPLINDTNRLKIKTIKKTIGSAAVVYFLPSDTGKYTITLKAQCNGVIDSQNVTVYSSLKPTIKDTAGPVISFITRDSLHTSSASPGIDLTCTDSSGVDSVSCLYGAHTINAKKNADGTYVANLVGLTIGVNTVIFTATDLSANANITKDTIIIIYDPTMDDNTPPAVTLKNPLNADQSVKTDTLTVRIVCHDDNGIKSVNATRAGLPVTVTTENDSIYSVKLDSLTAGQSDTLIFTVKDKSTKENPKVFSVIIRYNREPGVAILSTPADNATGIALKPTFVWTGGDDPDKDSVTYTLKYGTTETNLNQTQTGITAKQYTLTSNLANTTSYYWQIVTITAVNGDSVVSGIYKFTTVDSTPVITAAPKDTAVKVGTKAKFSVTATGATSYQWLNGTTAIIGATSSSYTTPATVAGDDKSTYRCIVSSGGGVDTSALATLTIEYGVVYDGNGNTSGTVPTDGDNYANGEMVTAKLNSGALSKTGYTFTGWNTKADGTGTTYAAGSDKFAMGDDNSTLYAKWTAVSYTITYNLNSGTNSASNPVSYTIETVTITFANPTRAGYIFGGWYTKSDLSGSAVTTIEKGSIDNVVLYAKWSQAFSVTYNANGGGSGAVGGYGSGTVPVDSKVYIEGASVTALANSGNLTKTGYVFDGWNESADGTGTNYTAGTGTFKMGSANVTLYAKWVIKDASGNIYTEIKIGDQVWMVQNLKTRKFRDGTDIPDWSSVAGINARVYAGDQTISALYNGFAVDMIAPAGWHVAKSMDWITLSSFVNRSAKAIASKENWNTPTGEGVSLNAPGINPSTNNSTGFTAFPCGIFNPDSVKVLDQGKSTSFWVGNSFVSVTYYTIGSYYELDYDNSSISVESSTTATHFFSVRCIRDY